MMYDDINKNVSVPICPGFTSCREFASLMKKEYMELCASQFSETILSLGQLSLCFPYDLASYIPRP